MIGFSATEPSTPQAPLHKLSLNTWASGGKPPTNVPLVSLQQPAKHWAYQAADGVIAGVSHPTVWYPLNTALYALAESGPNRQYSTGSATNGLLRSVSYRKTAIGMAKAESRFLKKHPQVLEWVNQHPWLGGLLLSTGVAAPALFVSEGLGWVSAPITKAAEGFVWKHVKQTWAGSGLKALWKVTSNVLGNVYVLGGLLAVLTAASIVRLIRRYHEAKDFKNSYREARKTLPYQQVDPLTLRYAIMMVKNQPAIPSALKATTEQPTDSNRLN